MIAKVKLTVRNLFDYFFYHMYMRPIGILYAIVAVLTIAGGIWYMVIGNRLGLFFILLAVVYVVLQPLSLYSNAKRQMQLSYMQREMYYELTEEGVRVWQGDVTPDTVKWESLVKIVHYRNIYIIYGDKNHGSVIPEDSLQCSKEDWNRMVQTHMDSKKVKGFS